MSGEARLCAVTHASADLVPSTRYPAVLLDGFEVTTL